VVRRMALLLLVPLFSIASAPAEGHLWAHRDSDDAPGRDIARVELSTRYHGRLLVGELSTHDGRHVYGHYTFAFDSRGDAATDYTLEIAYDGASGGIIDARLLRADGTDTGAEVRDSCDTGQDGTCWFPISFPYWRLRATRHIRWRVQASQFDYGRRPVVDDAPDAGWYRH